MRNLGIIAILVGLLLTIASVPAYATAKHETVGICHATSSKSNPWVYLEVDTDGLNGHGDHEDDLIGVTSCPTIPTTSTTTKPTTTTTEPCEPPTTIKPTTTTTVKSTTTTTSTTDTPITTTTVEPTTTTTIPEVTATTWLVTTTTSTVPVSTTPPIVPIVTTTSTTVPVTTTTILDVPPVTDPPREVPTTVMPFVPLTSTTSTSLAQSGPSLQSESSTEVSMTLSAPPSTQTVSELALTGADSQVLLGMGLLLLLAGSGLLGLSRNIQGQ